MVGVPAQHGPAAACPSTLASPGLPALCTPCLRRRAFRMPIGHERWIESCQWHHRTAGWQLMFWDWDSADVRVCGTEAGAGRMAAQQPCRAPCNDCNGSGHCVSAHHPPPHTGTRLPPHSAGLHCQPLPLVPALLPHQRLARHREERPAALRCAAPPGGCAAAAAVASRAPVCRCAGHAAADASPCRSTLPPSTLPPSHPGQACIWTATSSAGGRATTF